MTAPTLHRLSLALAASAALALAACQPAPEDEGAAQPAETSEATPPEPTGAEAQADGGFSLEAEGLRYFDAGGRASPLAFGTEAEQAVQAVARAMGPAARRGTNAECPAGELAFAEWESGLTLTLQDGRFVGWTQSAPAGAERALTTVNGIGVGASREELEAAFAGVSVQETSLGTEFDAGGLYGLIEDGRISTLWAGTTCIFR